MEKNEKSDIGHLEKLALLSDAVKDIFPDGKTTIAFELNKEDYKTIQGYFRKIDSNFNRFQIDISGTEFLFLNESYFQELEKKESEIEKPKEEPIEIKKMGFWNKIYSLLSSKKSS